MRNFKKIFNKLYVKIIILIVVFLGVVGIYFLINNQAVKETTQKMGQASLPIIYMNYNNERINMLYGYTGKMDNVYMRDTITILPESYNLNIEIDNYQEKVKEITYEVRSIDSKNLVERGAVKVGDVKDGTLKAKIKFDEIIKQDTEYLLIINISTEKFDQIQYYTRLVNPKENYITEQLEFINHFLECCFDKAKREEIISYLEPDASKNDNSNFGFVNIYSNYKQVSWGEMNPTMVTQPIVKVKEQFGTIGSFELSYIISTTKNEVTEYYNVTEYYRVNIANDRAYLLDFERSTSQIFSPSTSSVTNSKLILGINNELEIDVKTNTDGNILCFSNEGNLWSVNTTTNEITSIFSFLDKDYTELRNNNTQHEIKVINVDDDGNVDFIVYGYMNRGQHEGDVGVGLYHYTLSTNTVEELIFVPSSRPYEILNQTLGKLLYVRGNELLYLMIDDYIYSIDISGKEYVEIASGLKDGNYVISYGSDKVAWHASGSVNASEEIRVLNLETGDSHTVYAEDNKYIKALGFLGDDLVYGIANQSDLIIDAAGTSRLYMVEVNVVNSDNLVERTETQEGIYFTGATTDYNRVNLSRVKRDTYEQYPELSIWDTKRKEDILTRSSIATDSVYKKQVVISLLSKINAEKIITVSPKEILFNSENSLTLRNMISSKEKYFVYAKGKIINIYDEIVQAIRLADEQSGVVIDDKQQYVWARGVSKKSASLASVKVTPNSGQYAHMASAIEALLKYNGVGDVNVVDLLQSGHTPLEIINTNLSNRGVDITGCTLNQVCYFISAGQPVLAMINNTDAILMVGYNANNIQFIDLDNSQSYTMSIAEAEATLSGKALLSVKK